MSNITLKPVQMTDGTRRLQLDSPYHPALPARLKALGGKWNADRRVWLLPADLEQEARQLCVEFYSIDPLAETPAETVTVRLTLENIDYVRQQTLYLFGREVLHRPFRDSAVRVGQGVSIISGGFGSSGGSMRYPVLGNRDEDTVLLVRDVPRSAYDAFVAEHPDVPAEIVTVEETPPLDARVAFAQAMRLATELAGLYKNLNEEQKRLVITEMLKPMALEEQELAMQEAD